MRALILIAAVVLIFALVGWISFSKGPDRASVNLETGAIRQDTQQAMQKGGELLRKAGDRVEADANRQPDATQRTRQTETITR